MMGLAATANVRGLQEYVDALEVEKRKMEVFQRELPLCLDLVAQAIEGYKRQMLVEEEEEEDEEEEVGCCGVRSQVLEELISLRPVVSCDGAEEKRGSGEASEKKTEWLKSVKLWTQDAVLSKDDGKVGAEKGKEGGQNRKARRSWSPELHQLFVHSLQLLGGSHAATPKQIRELMKVDGLTNDEVKSHLQKYRLHARRPTSQAAAQANGTSSTPQATPQVVLGVWMPTNRYATVSTTSLPSADDAMAQASGFYTSITSLPLESNCKQLLHIPKQKQSNSSPRGHLRTSENTANSCSTASTTSS